MNNESELMETVKNIIEKRGKEALEKAQKEILSLPYDGGIVQKALRHFARVTLRGALPVFPALISLSCKAVGGKTEKTVSIGAAMTLIAAAADVHDDVIDKSVVKGSKPTVFGKFGKDIAILVGDALIIQGLMLLHKECESLAKSQREIMLYLVSHASFEISHAEAIETKLRKKFDLQPQEYFEIIKMKAVVPEIHSRIGAILGNGDARAIETMGHYGRTFGILSTIREEFIDLLEYPEFQNRLRNECLPLPMIYALQNLKIKTTISPFLQNEKVDKRSFSKMTEIVMNSQEVQELKEKMNSMVREEVKRLTTIKNLEIRKELEITARAMMENL